MSEVTIAEQAKMSAEGVGEKDKSGSRSISTVGTRENLRGEEEDEGRKGRKKAGHQKASTATTEDHCTVLGP